MASFSKDLLPLGERRWRTAARLKALIGGSGDYATHERRQGAAQAASDLLHDLDEISLTGRCK